MVSLFKEAEETSLLGTFGFETEDSSLCPSLSLTQRLLGCGVCLASGWILSFGAFQRILLLLNGNPTPFVVFFTLGVILNLTSSFFITGPKKQFTQMFDEKRRYATFSLISTIILTLTVSTQDHFKGQEELLIFLLVVQFIAQIYYILTYVPFGMDVISSCSSSACTRLKEAFC